METGPDSGSAKLIIIPISLLKLFRIFIGSHWHPHSWVSLFKVLKLQFPRLLCNCISSKVWNPKFVYRRRYLGRSSSESGHFCCLLLSVAVPVNMHVHWSFKYVAEKLQYLKIRNLNFEYSRQTWQSGGYQSTELKSLQILLEPLLLQSLSLFYWNHSTAGWQLEFCEFHWIWREKLIKWLNLWFRKSFSAGQRDPPSSDR